MVDVAQSRRRAAELLSFAALIFLIACVGSGAATKPVAAQPRSCKAPDHFHVHQGALHPERDKAEASAILEWRKYTAGEYGDDWAYWSVADQRSLACERSGGADGATGQWRCIAKAVPCRG